MVFECDGVRYKSRREYFELKNPEVRGASANDVDRWLYHNVPEFRVKRQSFYREKYRDAKNGCVRGYIKFSSVFVGAQCDHADLKALGLQVHEAR